MTRALAADAAPLTRKPAPGHSGDIGPGIELDEIAFRWMMNQDAMATEKLAAGIRQFAVDKEKLESRLVD